MARKKRIIGASRLKRKLKRMPEEITAELKKTIHDQSHSLLREIQARTPVSGDAVPLSWEGNPRKHLRDAWEVRISKDGLFSRIGIMGKRNKNTFFFATFLEFGTKYIRRIPMVVPSWTRRREHTRREIRKATLRALRRTAQWKVSDV